MADHETLLAAWADYQRPLVGLAASILKDPNAAEDAVQEAFLRLAFQTTTTIDDVRGWLIVVVTRLCIDHLRSAAHRRESTVGDDSSFERATSAPVRDDPAELVSAVDDLRRAVATLLSRLSPAEQAAFVLHDIFQLPFEEVADALRRSPEACRQLASRARRAIDAGRTPGEIRDGDVSLVTEKFVAACQGGSLEELIEVLAPGVIGVADFGRLLPKRTLRGQDRVANRLRRLFGRRRFALVTTALDSGPAVVVVRLRDIRMVGVLFLIVDGSRIAHIEATNQRHALT